MPQRTAYGSARRDIVYTATDGRMLSLTNLIPYNFAAPCPSPTTSGQMTYQWPTHLDVGPETRCIKGLRQGGRGLPTYVARDDDVDMSCALFPDHPPTVVEYCGGMTMWYMSKENASQQREVYDMTATHAVAAKQILQAIVTPSSQPQKQKKAKQNEKKRHRATGEGNTAGANMGTTLHDQDPAHCHKKPKRMRQQVTTASSLPQNALIPSSSASSSEGTHPSDDTLGMPGTLHSQVPTVPVAMHAPHQYQQQHDQEHNYMMNMLHDLFSMTTYGDDDQGIRHPLSPIQMAPLPLSVQPVGNDATAGENVSLSTPACNNVADSATTLPQPLAALSDGQCDALDEMAIHGAHDSNHGVTADAMIPVCTSADPSFDILTDATGCNEYDDTMLLMSPTTGSHLSASAMPMSPGMDMYQPQLHIVSV